MFRVSILFVASISCTFWSFVFFISNNFSKPLLAQIAMVFAFLSAVIVGCVLKSQNKSRNALIGGIAYYGFLCLMLFIKTEAEKSPASEFLKMASKRDVANAFIANSNSLPRTVPESARYLFKVNTDISLVQRFMNAVHREREVMCPNVKPEKLPSCYRVWIGLINNKSPLSFSGLIVMMGAYSKLMVDLDGARGHLDAKTHRKWVVNLILELIEGQVLIAEQIRKSLDVAGFGLEKEYSRVILKSIADKVFTNLFKNAEEAREYMSPEEVTYFEGRKIWLEEFKGSVHKKL